MNGHAYDLKFRRHHDELREFWQARALIHLDGKKDYALFAVLMSMLAHAYPFDAMVTLMKVAFPGFRNIRPPFYSSAGKIMKGGEVAADLVGTDLAITRNAQVFKNRSEMEGAFRTLADELKLDDTDRKALFEVVRRWIVADFGRDPNRVEAA